MRPIKALFKEVKYELIKILLLNLLLESSILFLGVHLLLNIFGVPIWFSAIITMIFFGIRFYKESEKLSLKKIEERNPELREMLRTAADNQDTESIMAEGLFNDVIKLMRGVSSGTFLDMDLIIKRIAIILVLSLVLVSMAFFNIDFDKFKEPLQSPFIKAADYIKGAFSDETTPEAVLLTDDLYGEARMADLSNSELDLKINPALNEIDFSNVEDADDLGTNIEDYPGEAVAVAGSANTAHLEDVTDRKTAAEYSQSVKK